MTLFQIIQILKEIALTQPNIKSATDGSIYDIMNTNPSVKYDVVHFSQTTHQSDEETDYYGLNIFYVSRLEDSLEDNRLQIQSIGKEVLDNIIRTFCENWGIDFPIITYTPFTQKFNDLCAGCYCNLRLEIPKEIICADDFTAEVVPGSGIKLQDIGITITQNGLIVVTPDAEYDGIGEIRIETNVPQTTAVLQDKEVEYTANGSYTVRPDPAYDGLSSVSVDVDVPDRYDEGYDDGKQDGENEQKAKLAITSFTENNTYIRENGWSAVTVDVPATGDRYDEGYADGVAAQKAKMVATAITENGAYGRPDGYSAVTVNVPSDYQDGYDDGVEDQKGKLTTLSVNENGIYTREDGWSAITVAVPQTGSSNADLIANLQGDYYLIPYGTTHLRNYVFYRTCFSSITIPTTVTAIGNFAFADNTCLTSITIPDSVQTLGEYAFSGCSNLQTAILGDGLSSLRSSTFSSCGSLTGITIPSGITEIESACFYGCSGLTEMTFEGLTPPTIHTGTSLGSTAYTFPIYVPCQSLDAYKTAFGTRYAPRIQCREQEMITAITLNVSSAITDSGTATTTYSPSNAYVDYYYTSSNSSIATIDPNTGVITVVANGSVTICTIDRISGLQDCKQVSVAKSVPYATSISINVPATITNSATATTTVTPSSAQTNLQYSSSDTSKATIGASTGKITALASGTVQFCVTDTLSGLQSCKNANVRKSATAITINVPSTVTDSATATTTVSPAGATTNLRYSSSDTSKATINATTGTITVISDGTVTFCVTDSISSLQNCKTVTVVKNEPGIFDIVYNVTSTGSPTAIKAIAHSGTGYYASGTSIVSGKLNNGTYINVSGTSYTFPTSGQVNVAYTLSGTTLSGWICKSSCPAPVFENILTIREVSLKDNVEYLGAQTFAGCSNLKKVVISDSLKTLGPKELPWIADGQGGAVKGRGVFEDCTSLTSVTLGNGLAYDAQTNPDGGHITPQCFKNCSSLPNINLPAGIHSIDDSAFNNCTSLSSITLNSADIVWLESGALDGCTALRYIYVPANLVSRYRNHTRWSDYANIITPIP